jgi:hypothetical protein
VSAPANSAAAFNTIAKYINKQQGRATARHTALGDAAPTAPPPPTPPAAKQKAVQKLSLDGWPHPVSTLLSLKPKLEQTRSAVGFVGLDVHYEAARGSGHSRTVLHNCLGMWWGCVPFETPALLYHTGHWVMVSDYWFCLVAVLMSAVTSSWQAT